MTGDRALAEPARKAIAFAAMAQMPDGGWRYTLPKTDKDRGDMSVSGWFMMAVKSGEMAGLEVPGEVYRRLEKFLDAVYLSEKQGYGYQINEHDRYFRLRPALTAEGLLCRQYLGWPQRDPRLLAGVDLLLETVKLDFGTPQEPSFEKDVYAWYYITQVCHHLEGPAWQRWNARMREELPAKQIRSGREEGSWNPAYDRWGTIGGRLFVTCMCTYMLEVYYRHLPLYAGANPPN